MGFTNNRGIVLKSKIISTFLLVRFACGYLAVLSPICCFHELPPVKTADSQSLSTYCSYVKVFSSLYSMLVYEIKTAHSV